MSTSEVEILQNYISVSSLGRMKKYTHNNAFRIDVDKNEERKDQYFGEHMSIIMLWGMIGSIVLKVHFDMKTAMKLAAEAFGRNQSEITVEFACDFMKEFCNLEASNIKGFFEKHKLMFGMSLPFLADGHDEIIFKKIRDPRANYSFWRLTSGTQQLILTSEICLLEKAPIRDIRAALTGGASEDSDEVQFL